MLEGLAAWVLNNYLGRYVENLNTDQLSIGLLKGEVELECLPLKKEAFYLDDIPVEVVSGYVGKIRLKIPVTRIKSEPWVISIEQLYIVVGPTPKAEYDEEKEQEKECMRKLNKLDLMEAEWRSEHDAKQETSYYASSYSSWVSYGTSFLSNIVENLQLKIKDVHIRFEDGLTTPNNPVACGITIDSLTVQSANENWQPQFVQKGGDGETTRKLVELQNLSFYWDVCKVNLVSSLQFQELVDAMLELLSNKRDVDKSPHDFLFEPVCAKARLQRNCNSNPLKSRHTPRINCDIFVDRFLLTLNELQYGCIVNWFYEFSRYAKALPYLKWRPSVDIFGHAKEWWLFAARPTIEIVKKRKNSCCWDYVLTRARQNVLYVKAYTQHLINPVTLLPEYIEHKSWMEQEIDFKELKILREIAMERVVAIEEAQKSKNLEIKSKNTGLLQRWFPLWSGWYGGTETNSNNDSVSTDSSANLENSRVLEEELLDVLNDSVEEVESLFCRDYVFARINFTLKSGVLIISTDSPYEPIVNLELASVLMGVELRPRARSTLFDLSLGALYLRDAMNVGSQFPFIAAPQGQNETMKVETPSSLSSFMSIKKVFPWVMSNADSTPVSSNEPEESLFHLTYEVRPLHSHADYKLHVQSRSLDVVYNASVFHRVREFFGSPHRLAAPALNTSKQRSRLGEELAAVASKVKQQTKEELLKNWDKLLKGHQSLGKRWDIQLNISTPQIIIPESLFVENTTMVIFNFGRLHFSTDSCRPPIHKVQATSPTLDSYFNEEDEDEFRTPFSTPPGEQEIDDIIISPVLSSPPTFSPNEELTEASVLRRMYVRYSLHLNDLQILVTKTKTNWKYAYLQGTSTSHVVNRFSIFLQLERRVVHTNDPKWPRVKISGDLPTLVIHVDELKIDALRNCLAVVTSPSLGTESPQQPWTFANFASEHDASFTDSDKLTAEALLLITEFQIGQMSLDVQSAGRSLAELQVTTIKSSVNKRLMDTSVCFTVQSLLLVDAMQTFGPDYELLVASHKNISLDSVSGSMRDSEPTSPSSPASPHSYGGGAPININAAIRQLERNQMKITGAYSPLLCPLTPIHASDTEALIVIEFTLVKTEAETTSLVSVQFNNLDIIANQETIREMIAFFNRYYPKPNPNGTSVRHPLRIPVTSHIKLSFDFHRLSVLLVQLIPSSEDNFITALARKVATVTLTNASIQASFDETSDIRGSLGGVHIVDLANERSKFSKILSVGRDPSEKRHHSLVEQLQADLYTPATAITGMEPEAFFFTLSEVDALSVLQIRMATVKCVYSTAFWTDLTSCLTEFQKYAADVGGSLKNAATEVAREYLSGRNGDQHLLPSTDHNDSSQLSSSSSSLRLDVIIDSPILTIPESLLAECFLEAHLGKITVRSFLKFDEVFQERYESVIVEIRDMNLYSRQFEGGLNNGYPILHDAALELNVNIYGERLPVQMNMIGRIVTPLQVSLVKCQYQQILRTFSLLTTAGLKVTDTSSQLTSFNAHEAKWNVNAVFELPNFSVMLANDLCEDMISVTFSHFAIDYKQWLGEPVVVDITLDSVTMEDLSVSSDSKHRFLMISSSPTHEKRIRRAHKYLSSSCPDVTSTRLFLTSTNSLPDKLDTQNVFQNLRRLKEKMMYGANVHLRHYSTRSIDKCPCTPPPSPLPDSPYRSAPHSEALVHVKIHLNELFDQSGMLKKEERVIDVNFNCLDMVIKYLSWKIVLDFFGNNTDVQSSSLNKINPEVLPEAAASKSVDSSTKTNICVRRLSVLLAREDYELANLTISNLKTNIVREDGFDLEVNGTLGQVSLVDLTAQAKLYRERFTTLEEEVLVFRFFKYGSNDTYLKRDFDANLELTMSAVHYVHTNRFSIELTSFIKRLMQVQDSIETKKAISMDSGSRSSRLKLQVSIQTPAIVLPVALWSRDLLIASLDKIQIQNRFVTSEVTSQVCLIDICDVTLSGVELCIGTRSDTQKFKTNGGGPLLTEKFHLNLVMERNLDRALNKTVPDMHVKGAVSAVTGEINNEQYQIIRGILEHNIGEEIYNSKQHYYGPQTIKEPYNEGWTHLLLQLKLVDVTLDFVLTPNNSSLAKVNFINSELTYRSTSFGSSEIDLVSREILIWDTRFKNYPANNRPNVFYNILQATRHSKNSLQPKVTGKSAVSDGSHYLQAELHYRSTRDFTRMTVILNHMRVIVILDWWTDVLKFVTSSIDAPKEVVKPEHNYPTLHTPSGVITRHGSRISNDTSRLPFDLKINVTETGIVIVEDSAVWDTNAVILETTAIVNYSPASDDKPLWCTVHRLEVFSCILGLEEDTALSIVDPVINADLVIKKKRIESVGCGFEELTTFKGSKRILEISISELRVRLSYHDLRSFVRILDSFPLQMKAMVRNSESSLETADDIKTVLTAQDMLLASKIGNLEVMGFSHGDCFKALTECKFDVGEAALWLTQNAKCDTEFQKDVSEVDVPVEEPIELKAHIGTLCVCLIDDCKDADVPLIEFSLRDFLLEQKSLLGEEDVRGSNGVIGCARGRLNCDYYNRSLSGWEPFVEPFGFKGDWKKEALELGKQSSVGVSIAVDDLVDVNLTSTLLEIYRNVKMNWTDDYYKQSNRVGVGETVSFRRRSPFVPFALKNSTGCRLFFTTITTDQHVQLENYESANPTSSTKESNSWTKVEVDEVVSFTFEERLRMRHKDTRDSRIHQLLVRIEGWQQVAPVSVDKVGVFFRDAQPAVVGKLNDIARAVFEVILEGSARKLITVRSALVLRNLCETTVEIRLDSSKTLTPISSLVIHLKPNDCYPVPLTHVNALIYSRPYDRSSTFLYCCSPIRWQHITKANETQEDTYICNSMSSQNQRLYNNSIQDHYFCFCARIRRNNYPLDSLPANFVRPAHTISLLPPITLSNLLPFDLIYRLNGVAGNIRPGKRSSIHYVNVLNSFKIDFQFETTSFETFKLAQEFEIMRGCSSFSVTLEAKDNQNRSLMLQVKGLAQQGGSSLEISIGAEYWIINRTGLPLIFKQEGVTSESAGQSSDNEKARSVAPLLFSFADREAPLLCSVRIGRMHHPSGEPRWCRHFNLQKGVQFRRLYVLSRSARPDWVYSVGIDVHIGPAKYGDVHIVTLTPRFQLDNHSSHKLEFSQKYALELGHLLTEVHLSALPKSFLPFHWPRLDHEQLLCVRMSDVNGCGWSGGFHIERIDSFHISMRDDQGKPVFLRVEVVLLGATYTVVFTDADDLPPPYFLQNLCEVPIICHQTLPINEERLRVTVRPNTIVPYAWDEPTCDPFMTCIAPGGSSASYNLNVFGDCKMQLSYENFIYIAFTKTFSKNTDLLMSRFDSSENAYEELVLTVMTGSAKVILQPKVKGDRTQLWRMTSEGMLQHEGSSPPRNSRKPGSISSSRNHFQILVLDIAEIALQPNKYTALALKKPNPQRSSTQTWEFSEDGRLRCRHQNLYVQCADGYHGLRAGFDVVIGPLQPVIFATTSKGVPVEQAISRHRLYPGSGLICVRVIPDGPTRVLQIFDITKKSSLTSSIMIGSVNQNNAPQTSVEPVFQNWQMKLWLPVGLGVSIINRAPEECLYARFVNIMLEYTQSKTDQCLNGSVQDFQVDNQLFDAECPVFLYVTTVGGVEEQRNFHPSISFVGSRINNSRRHLNVDIYKGFQLQVKNITLMIEERLLYKFLQFIGYCDDERWNDFEDGSQESHGFFKAASVALSKRNYFGNFKLTLAQVRLSVITSSNLSQDLRSIKTAAGLTLVRFEDALVELDPFVRSHSCETWRFLLDSIWEHYKEALKSQATKILGAVDFLGNPIGLVNDLSEGFSELIGEGNVGGILKITHGISNTAAKMTGSLSDGLSMVTMDERHLENRHRIQSAHGGTGGEHVVAGLKGLGFGLYSGFTSIVTHTYEGASSDGIQGFITGLGKGLVGTFTKPAAGVLDLTSSMASAVRDTSKSKSRKAPDKIRARRLCVGPGGLLPKYSADQSRGLDILYQLNDKDYSEMVIAIEGLNYSNDGLFALISSTKIYFLSLDLKNSSRECILTIPLKDLYHCKFVQDWHQGKMTFYLELTIKGGPQTIVNTEVVHINRPRVLCESETIANKVSQQINYAKGLYDEMVHTLTE